MKYILCLILFAPVIGFTQANPNWMAGDTYAGDFSMWWLVGDNTIQGGYDSTAYGVYSLGSLNTGNNNSAFGYYAMTGCCGTSGITGSYNSAFGDYSTYYLTSGFANSGFGSHTNYYLTTGSNNTAHGAYALYSNTTGSGNTAIGFYALLNNVGNYNVALGTYAGYYPTASTNSIFIGNRGASTDSAVIKLGTQGQQTKTYIAGIYGTTAPGPTYEVVVNSAGQLGYSKTVVQAPVKQLTEADVRRIVREELASKK